MLNLFKKLQNQFVPTFFKILRGRKNRYLCWHDCWIFIALCPIILQHCKNEKKPSKWNEQQYCTKMGADDLEICN